MPHQLRLVLPSEHSQLERVVDESQAFLDEHIADEDLVYRVVLLTTEAVTNAIEHGNGLDPEKQVDLAISVQEETIEISVEDEGPGFEPTKVDDPLEGDHILRDGGRGLYLMREMADEVQYDREGRRVRILFRRAAGA